MRHRVRFPAQVLSRSGSRSLISALTLDERTPPTEITNIVIQYNIDEIQCQEWVDRMQFVIRDS